MADTVVGILGLARKAGKCHLKENSNVPDLSIQRIGRAPGIHKLEDCNLLLPTRKKKKYCGRRRNSSFSCFTRAQISTKSQWYQRFVDLNVMVTGISHYALISVVATGLKHGPVNSHKSPTCEPSFCLRCIPLCLRHADGSHHSEQPNHY